MNDGLGILLISLVSSIGLVAIFLTIRGLFPRAVADCIEIGVNQPGRSFLVGIVNLLFFGAVALGLIAVSDGGGGQIFLIPALILVGALTVFALIGLTSIVGLIGLRLLPERSLVQQTLWAGVILTLGSLTPFLGWFLLFPYLLFFSLGVMIIRLVRRKPPPTQAPPT